MKISISNFKAIEKIEFFPIEKINILTGVNSGGKSSLIQLVLLIKQTLEARSAESPLKLNKPYVSLGKFENIVRKGSDGGTLGFSIMLEGDELTPRLKRVGRATGTGKTIDKVILSVEFKRSADRIVVEKFSLILSGGDGSIYAEVKRNSHGKSYALNTNAPEIFFDAHEQVIDSVIPGLQVSFFSFFPDYLSFGEKYYGSMVIDQVRVAVQRIFSRTSYIGPLREEPRDFYFQDDDLIEHIGNKGENAAYILAKHAKDLTQYLVLKKSIRGFSKLSPHVGTLEEAVNYWMCEIFRLGKKIKVETSKGNRYFYSVLLTGMDGAKVPINHVGFGVSQIFPVLVEGLRKTNFKRIIILEQPEIHLHPRVQSFFFDFISSVTENASFLIETHSDHFITRLRLRIAEDDADDLLKSINLTFVEPSPLGVDYKRLEFNEIGSLDCWPDGFFDQYENDMRALVKAQANKRRELRQP